jgi:hypothetical protein
LTRSCPFARYSWDRRPGEMIYECFCILNRLQMPLQSG